MTEAKPFYSLELQIDVDLEGVVTDDDARHFTERFLADVQQLIKMHTTMDMGVSIKLNRQILEYIYTDKVSVE